MSRDLRICLEPWTNHYKDIKIKTMMEPDIYFYVIWVENGQVLPGCWDRLCSRMRWGSRDVSTPKPSNLFDLGRKLQVLYCFKLVVACRVLLAERQTRVTIVFSRTNIITSGCSREHVHVCLCVFVCVCVCVCVTNHFTIFLYLKDQRRCNVF